MLTMNRRRTASLCLVSWTLLICGAGSLLGFVDARFDLWRLLGLQDSLISLAAQVCSVLITFLAGLLAFTSTIALISSAVIPEAGEDASSEP
jgi:hypothetical protein